MNLSHRDSFSQELLKTKTKLSKSTSSLYKQWEGQSHSLWREMKELQLLTQHLSLWRNTGERKWVDKIEKFHAYPLSERKLTVWVENSSVGKKYWKKIMRIEISINHSGISAKAGRVQCLGFIFQGAILNWENLSKPVRVGYTPPSGCSLEYETFERIPWVIRQGPSQWAHSTPLEMWYV